MKFKGIINIIENFAKRNSPEILTGLGIAGMVTTTIIAVKATPKANRIMHDLKREYKDKKVPKMQVIKEIGPCYVPSIVMGTCSCACILGATSINARRNAALATAYKLSETAFSDYREKVIETLGEKKDDAVRSKVAQKHMDENPVQSKQVEFIGNGDTLFFDPASGRYFRSSMENVKYAVNEINAMINDELYASLNDFYDQLNMDHIGVGDDLGWSYDTGKLDVLFDAAMATNNQPCIELNYLVSPSYDFMRK